MTNLGTNKLVDISGNNVLNTVFGEQVTGIRKPSIAAQFQYGIRDQDITETSANGGSYSITNALLTLSTGTNAAGSESLESKSYVRYIPGHETYCLFTAVFSTPVANSYQRAGLFDSNNGFWIGYEDTTFYIARRKGGTDTKTAITVADVYPGYDTTKGNIYKISYGYLGFATITFSVMKPDGSWALLGKLEYPNSATVTHTANTNLPVKSEIGNTGNTTDLTISHGSVAAGIIDGAGGDPMSRDYSYKAPDKTLVASTLTPIIAFRNKSTYKTLSNRMPARLLYVSSATEGNKPVGFDLIKNPTYTGGAWSDADVDGDSTLEVNTTGTLGAGPYTYFLNWNIGKSDSLTQNVGELDLLLPPGGVAVFAATSANASDVSLAIRWKELF